MSRAKLITVICWTISAVALLALVAWFFLGSVFSVGFSWGFNMGSFSPVGTHSVQADNIDSLEIDWTSGRVYVGTHHGNEILITEFAQRGLRDGEELSLGVNDGTLSIQFTARRGVRLGNTQSKQLEVLIPNAISQEFASLQIQTVSGRVEVSNIQADNFTVSTTSGRIELRSITADTLSARTTSGRIALYTTDAETIHLQTVSGRIEVTGTEAQSLRTQTTSGRHELSGSFEDVNARSTSGRIEITSRIVPESLVAHATSGRLAITVPGGDAISVQHSTGSGRFSSAIPIITHGGADAQFRLSTSSGRITIYALAG